MFRYKSKYKKVGVLPIRIVKSVSSVGPSSERNVILSDEGPTLETLDFTIRIGSTPTFLYFDLYLTRFDVNNNNNLFRIPTSPKCFSVGSCKNYVQYNAIQYNTMRYDTRYDTSSFFQCSFLQLVSLEKS